MIPVDPHTRTTLVLNKNYQSNGRFFTARAAIRHLMNSRVKGIDAMGNCVSWNGSDVENLEGVGSSLSWADGSVNLYSDHPCLRSAPNAITGLETQWPVPTIVVCTYHFGYRRRSGQNISLKTLYHLCKGVCQYCVEKIPFSEATKDHIYPKSLGGPNDQSNIALACRSCNSAKEDTFPYHDVNGQEVRSRVINQHTGVLPVGMSFRDEWKPYLYISE